MRLELGKFPVTEVEFGDKTAWTDGKLEIDRAGLTSKILEDPRVLSADFDLARPGDSVRITLIRDVIEPMVKVSGGGSVYPGICGRPVDTVGSGRTHKLTGVAVVEVSDTPLYLGVGMGNYTDRSVIDMRGNGDMSPASSNLINVCVLLEIDPGRDVLDRNDAAHAAALLVSDALAEAVKDLEPPELDVYELGKADPSLPKMVYILCQHSPEHHAGSVRGWGDHLYGLTRLHPPWVIHPNEMLDGALTFGDSWGFSNNPMLFELYGRHGKDLNFLGCVVIRTRWSSQLEKNVVAKQAAKTAKMLGAEGVIVVGMVGGNDFMEAVRTAQACELEGLDTVFVVQEDDPTDGGPPILEPLPEVKSIVSVGVGRAESNPPPTGPVDRVIGRRNITLNMSTGVGTIDAQGELPFGRSGLGWSSLDTRTSCFEV